MTKKMRKRTKVRLLRRALKRTYEISHLSARKIYRGLHGEGASGKIA